MRGAMVPARRTFIVVLFSGVALIGSLLAMTPATRADDTSMGGTGGSVYPTTSPDIRMEAETVQAVLYGGFAEYRCDFEFVNEGPPQTVVLGFPFSVTREEPIYGSFPPTAFRAWQDGRPLEVTLSRDVSQNDARAGVIGYFLHEATFDRGPTTITVSYLTRPSMSTGGSISQVAPPALQHLPPWDNW